MSPLVVPSILHLRSLFWTLASDCKKKKKKQEFENTLLGGEEKKKEECGILFDKPFVHASRQINPCSGFVTTVD